MIFQKKCKVNTSAPRDSGVSFVGAGKVIVEKKCVNEAASSLSFLKAILLSLKTTLFNLTHGAKNAFSTLAMVDSKSLCW